MENLTYLTSGDWELESSRLAEAEEAVGSIIETVVKDETIDGFIFTGDMFREYNPKTVEFARSSARAIRDALSDRRYQLAPIFLVGNHDRDIGVDRLTSIFQPEFHVISEPCVRTVNGHSLAFLPAPDRAAFGSSRQAEGNRTRDERLSEALEAALIWLEQEIEGSLFNEVPLFFHATVDSSVFGGAIGAKGLTWTIPTTRIADYGAAIGGHIHKPGQFDTAGHYVGGILPVDFGEKAINFRMLKLSLRETGDIEIESILLPKIIDLIEIVVDVERLRDLGDDGVAFVPSPLDRALEVIFGGIDDAGLLCNTQGEPYPYSLKVRLQLPKPELDIIPGADELADKIRETWPGLKRLTLKKEPVAEHKIRLELDEPADTLSLVELVDKWNEVSGGTADDGALARAIDFIKEEPSFSEWSSEGNYGFEPIRTEIKNFRQWEDVVIEWDNLRGAVSITGDNATGKTNFAEAPLFALYKKTPSSPDTLDDELRHGAESGHVVLTFRSGGRVYEVRRALERNSKGSVSCKSEFFEIEGYDSERSGKTPVCEKAIDIDKTIARLVGQREFVEATFYGTQDQIDSLIVATPAIWHKRIRESLGLERFEDFRKLSATRVRTEGEESFQLESRLSEVKAQLVTKKAAVEDFNFEGWEASQVRTFEEKGKLAVEIEHFGEELKGIEKAVQRRAVQLSTSGRLEKDGYAISAEFRENENKYERTELKIASLGEPKTIKLDEDITLDRYIEKLKDNEGRQHSIWKENERDANELEREIQRKSGRMDTLADVDTSIREKINEIRKAYETAVAAREALDDPPCISGISGASEAEVRRDILPSCPAWAAFSNGQEIVNLKLRAEKERERLNDNIEMNKALHEEVVGLEKKKAAVELLRDSAKRNVDKIRAEIDEARSALLYDNQKAGYEVELSNIIETNQRLDKKHQDIAAELKTLVAELKESAEIYQLQKDFEAKLAESRSILRDVEKALADLDAERKLFEQAEKNYAALVKREAELVEEIKDHGWNLAGWSILESAFHSTGIPFLLMERTIPALESTANELLAGTDLSLIFETEKLKKSDKKLKDEINVRFRDARGEFPLRSASGYQRAVLSFAARFALAKVGNEFWSRKPKVFIQDEGWGRFNVRRYDTARELIENVAKVFERFVYITHVEELADIADVRIRIEIVDGVSTLVEQ